MDGMNKTLIFQCNEVGRVAFNVTRSGVSIPALLKCYDVKKFFPFSRAPVDNLCDLYHKK